MTNLDILNFYLTTKTNHDIEGEVMKAIARPWPLSPFRVDIIRPGWIAGLLFDNTAGGSMASLAMLKSSFTLQVIPQIFAGLGGESESISSGAINSNISFFSGVPALKKDILTPG